MINALLVYFFFFFFCLGLRIPPLTFAFVEFSFWQELYSTTVLERTDPVADPVVLPVCLTLMILLSSMLDKVGSSSLSFGNNHDETNSQLSGAATLFAIALLAAGQARLFLSCNNV